MVFQVRTVLAFVIFRTVAAEVIVLVVEALGPVQARVGLTIVDVQLPVAIWEGKRETRGGESPHKTNGLLITLLTATSKTLDGSLGLFTCCLHFFCTMYTTISLTPECTTFKSQWGTSELSRTFSC